MQVARGAGLAALRRRLRQPGEEVRERLGALAEQRQQQRLELPPLDLDRGRDQRGGEVRVAVGVRPQPLGIAERARAVEVGELVVLSRSGPNEIMRVGTSSAIAGGEVPGGALTAPDDRVVGEAGGGDEGD